LLIEPKIKKPATPEATGEVRHTRPLAAPQVIKSSLPIIIPPSSNTAKAPIAHAEVSPWMTYPAPPAAPLTPQRAAESPQQMIPLKKNRLLEFEGRIGRLSMLAAWGVLLLCAIPVNLLLILLQPIAAVFTLMALTVFYVALNMRRLNDLDHHGGWVCALPVLVVAIGVSKFKGDAMLYGLAWTCFVFFQGYLLLAPGAETRNRFGPPRPTPRHEALIGGVVAVLIIALVMKRF
jgi:uncharacterized membrane protein YhaH (DUF805 family)